MSLPLAYLIWWLAGIFVGVGLTLLWRRRPIPQVIYCPKCGIKHIDVAHGDWKNPPHKTHQCSYCTWRWRTADVATTGVYEVMTRGKVDDTYADPEIGARVEKEMSRKVVYNLMGTQTGRLSSKRPNMTEVDR